MIVVRGAERVGMLQRALSAYDACSVRLFTNDLTPTADTTEADLVEPAEAWYAPPATNPLDWPVSLDATTKRAVAKGSRVIFDRGSLAGSLTVRGYSLFTDGGEPIYSERFAQPVVLSEDNSILAFRPKLELWS